ncbi:hypothetical protein ACFXOD_34675 [Streptomyces sp. NPDC059161]|uniref:hypothetical protein n=1 Tax=Streptomyces sp. NPDC059161 TaxID=3346749 RepID=UPI0036AE5C47
MVGWGASWVTNTAAVGNRCAWRPLVTRKGIDVVGAGTCAEHFVILLVVGDD